MRNFLLVLGAMCKNKLRFGVGKSRRSAILLCVGIALVYGIAMTAILSVVVTLQGIIAFLAPIFFFFVLLTAGFVVLLFGVIHSISVLYLSKDTDFYSALPIKASVVFAAKLTFVYLFESVIVFAIAFPVIVTIGIMTKAWAAYYIISFLSLVIVPALPLAVAIIFAIPIMYIAGKMKNRGVLALLFYVILFCGFCAVYLYFVFAASDINEQTVLSIAAGLEVVGNIFYPYTALASAAFGVPSFGFDVALSVLLNVLIFVGISGGLLCLLLISAKFMYKQAVKANNQIFNEKPKIGRYESRGSLRALIKREYVNSFRTTQTAFQCYCVMIIPTIIAVVFAVMFRSMGSKLAAAGVQAEALLDSRYFILVSFAMIASIIATTGNGASTTFSREGGAFATLKTLPVTTKTIVKAKAAAWLVFTVPAVAIPVILINAMMYDFECAMLSVFSILPLSVALVVFGILWDLASPKLKWTDPTQAIKHNGHVLVGQFIGIFIGIFAFAVINSMSGSYDFDVIMPIFWSIIYAELAIFAVVDIILYTRAEKLFERVEI